MTTESKTPWYKWIIIIASVAGATTTLLGAGAWLFREKIQNYIVSTVNESKDVSIESKLAEKMFQQEPQFKDSDVCWKIGKLYRDFYSSKQMESDILNKWIPVLEQEVMWRPVGYFVNVTNPDIVKFHHWDGRDYDAWSDEIGWFYVKNGLKYYH